MAPARVPESEVRPELIQRLATGPFPSFAMLAGMQLDLFSRLAERPRTAADLAAALGADRERLELLLYALVAVGLLELDDDLFANGPEAARFLARGSPAHVGEVHEGLAMMWSAALRTAESIRSGVPQARVDFAAMSGDELESFFRGFYNEALMAGHELARAYDFSARRALADVGGGSGGLAIGVTEAWPNLRATVVDLPGVVSITARFVARVGASDCVGVESADVVASPLPGTYDVAVLRALVQVLGPDEARRAILHVAAALEAGGEIFIIGRTLDDSRLSPLPAVLANLVFLNAFEGGRAYTEGEHRAWLGEAGFVDVEREVGPDGRDIIRARKAERR